MTRHDAITAGLATYRTGKPCKNGHDAPRYTSCGVCVECARKSRSEQLRAHNTARAMRTADAALFAYRLHPDDHAAALAFCQALDLQRGRTPQSVAALGVPPTPGAVVLPPAIAAARAQYEPTAVPEYRKP